jgi:signal recognition particle subunit SRP19
MKDYDRYIIWLDYFDSTLSRSEGRRVRLDQAVKEPTLQHLTMAAAELGLDPKEQETRHPKRINRTTGYVSVSKSQSKLQIINQLASALRRMKATS